MAVETEIIAIEFRTGSLKDAQKELGKTADSADKAADSADRVSGKLSGTERAAAQAAKTMGALQAAFGGLSVFVFMRTLTSATEAIYSATAAGERLRTTLDFASGGRGRQELAYITQQADKLGLQLATTAQAYTGLQAASRGTALEGEGARRVFEAVSKASSVMGLSAEQSGGALLALQQMVSKGTVQAEELRGQLGERLPGAFQIAARAMGVTTAELGKMLEAGQVVADDFLPKFAEQLERELGGAAEKAADTLDKAVNRFNDAWERLKRNVGDSGVANSTKAAIQGATGVLGEMSEAMEVARAHGHGMFLQLLAGSGAALQMAIGAQSLKREIAATEAEIERLNATAEKWGHLSIYGASQKAQAEALLRDLRAIKEAQDRVTGGPGGVGGGRGNVNPATVGQVMAAETKAAEARSKAYGDLMERLATPQEKFTAEVEKQKKLLGDLYTPEVEARIRAHMIKPASDSEAAQRKLNEALEKERDFKRSVQVEQVQTQEREEDRAEKAIWEEIKLRRQLQGERDNAIVNQGIAEREAYDKSVEAYRSAMDRQRQEEIAEWARYWDQVSQGMVDSLMQGGKSVAEYLKGLFRTLVLRPVLSAVVSPMAAAFSGALGMPGAASAATGGASALSGLGSIGSMLGGFGTAAGYGAQALFAGNGLGALSGGMSMLGAGSISQGLGMIAGVAGPIIAGVTLISSLLKSTKSPGEQHTGGFFSSSGASGMDAALGITNGQAGWARDLIKRANPEIEAMVKNTVGSVIESTTAQAKALGMDIAVGIDAGFAANTNGKGKNKNAFGYFDVTINGETVAEYVNRTLGEDVTKATAQWTSDMTDAVAKWVLGGKDLIKAGETAGQALARLSTNLTSVNSTFDVLGYRMFDASVDGAALASSLVDAFGSLERFSTLTGQFYQSYYSDSERFATSQRLLRDQFAALNMALPDSTAGFRAMVESAQAAGNNALLSNLLELGPAFYAVANAVEDVFNSISATTAQSVRDIEMSILGDAEKYQYLDREIEGLITKLSTATLPADIQATFEKINQGTMSAYNLLGADQQKALATQFIDRLYEAEAIAQSRLSVTGNQATTEEAQAKAAQDMRAVVEDMRKIRDTEQATATMNRQAAELNLQAAQTTKTIQLLDQYGQPMSSREVTYS